MMDRDMLIQFLRYEGLIDSRFAEAADHIEEQQARIAFERKVKDYCISKIHTVSHLEYIGAMERKFEKAQTPEVNDE